ncbi:MAG: SPOR domain-containing protein [Candidatus Azobacteroides sp.]|nr:SPOR domain-containing protein [Candidatus Azobacteroides sp.]
MQTVPFHIAYLLTRHECVVVPGLGAFVVSSSDRETANRWGILSPPTRFLEFNPEIKHNDGLLADSITKEKEFAYKEANLLIAQYVNNILHTLDEGKKVRIPGVGTLYSEDNKPLFHPDKTLSCNALNYGLTGFSLPFLRDVKQQVKNHPENKIWASIRRKFLLYLSAVIVIFIAICFIPTSLNTGYISPVSTQYAGLIRFLTRSPVVKEPNVNSYRYYVIIADSPDQLSAEKAAAEFQSQGFENATILLSDGKYRIYTNYFEDRTEAEQFLIRFQKDYPAHADAWILEQKTKK